MALCENMEALDEHTKQVTESTGAAKNMMESAYNNSLDAKLNDLSRTFENMYKNILSSDGMKTAVSGLTWVIEKFGNLKTVIAMVTTAFLVMKGKAITGFIADLAEVVAGESALSVATVGLTSVFNALKTAIATNPFGAIALAITGVITAMDLFGNEAENVKNKLQEMDNELSKNKEQLDSLKSLGDQYKELSSKTNLSTEETKRLTEVQNQLVKQFPNMLDYYDAMGNAHIKNADAIKAETDALNKKRAEELSDKMTVLESSSDKLRKDNNKYSAYSNAKYMTDFQNTVGKYAPDSSQYDEYAKKIAECNSKIRENNKQLSDNAQKIREANSDYSLLNQSLRAMADNSLKGVTDEWIKGTKTNQEYRDAIDKTSKALNSSSVQDALNKYQNLANGLKDGKNTSEEASYAYEKLKQALINAGISEQDIAKYMADTTSETKAQSNATDELSQSVGNLGKEYDNILGSMNLYKSILKEINETGTVSYDTLGNIISKAPELLNHLGSINDLKNAVTQGITVQEQDLTNTINQAIQAQRLEGSQSDQTANKIINNSNKVTSNNANNYRNDVNNHANAENNKSNNSNNGANARTNNEANVVNTNSKNYSIDTKNHAQGEGNKVVNSGRAGQSIVSNYNGVGMALTGIYSQDMANFRRNCQSKIDMSRSAASQIANMWNALGGSKQQVMSMSPRIGRLMEGSPMMKDLETLQKIQEEDPYFKSFGQIRIPEASGVSYGGSLGFSPLGFKPAGGFNSVGGSGSRGSGSKGGSGKSSSGNGFQELQLTIDRYKTLNDAIQKLTNEYQKYDTLMKNSSDKDIISYAEKKINVLNRERRAYTNLLNEKRKEMSEDRNTLSRYGFRFSADGEINNYVSKLKDLQNRVNRSKSESYKKEIENIAKVADRYLQNLNKDIPDTQNKIDGLKNSVIDAQKEIADVLKKQRDKYKEDLNKETEDLKKEIEKRKELRHREFEEDDYQTELDKAKKQLFELQDALREAIRTGDQEAIKYARKQIEEQQMNMSKLISDRDKTLYDQMVEDEENRIDENAKNKLKQIEEQLNDDNILKMVQSGVTNLNSAINKIKNSTSSINNTFAVVGDSINNVMNKGLDDTISKLSKIIDLAGNIGFSGFGLTNGGNASNSINVNVNSPITINGSANENDINKALNGLKDEIYNEIEDRINNG